MPENLFDVLREITKSQSDPVFLVLLNSEKGSLHNIQNAVHSLLIFSSNQNFLHFHNWIMIRHRYIYKMQNALTYANIQSIQMKSKIINIFKTIRGEAGREGDGKRNYFSKILNWIIHIIQFRKLIWRSMEPDNVCILYKSTKRIQFIL